MGDPSVSSGAIASNQGGRRELKSPSQTSVIGQQQQPLGIEIEAANRNQPGQTRRQGIKNRRSPLRVAVAGHQSHGLMVADQPSRLCIGHHLSVEGDDVVGPNLDRRRGENPTIERHATSLDQALHFATRGDPGPGKGLGNALAACFRGLTRRRVGGS